MVNKDRATSGGKRSSRSGKPHTIYFTPEQTIALDSLAARRRITKTELVKFAVDQMLDRIINGQLQLPLGV
jgi:hypothetical protein